jgi:hypothetical protein
MVPSNEAPLRAAALPTLTGSYRMSYARLFFTACTVVFAAGCIGPQGAAQPCECATGAATPTSPESGEATAARADAPSIPDPVVPTGTLIWDGGGISNLPSVEPPGSWFVYSDKTPTGVKTPPSVEEFTSAIENGAIHATGKGYTEWGGGIGTNLVGAALLTPVDASKFNGFSFKASGTTPMKFLVATVDTMPEFGRCKKCYDHFMVVITNLSKEMKTYKFDWSELKQTGWGDRVKLDTKAIVGLNWTSKDATAWDFTIDDVAFFE